MGGEGLEDGVDEGGGGHEWLLEDEEEARDVADPNELAGVSIPPVALS